MANHAGLDARKTGNRALHHAFMTVLGAHDLVGHVRLVREREWLLGPRADVEEVVDGWKADLNKDAAKYDAVLDKIELEEQKELDKSVSISRFGFVDAVLRRFCE